MTTFKKNGIPETICCYENDLSNGWKYYYINEKVEAKQFFIDGSQWGKQTLYMEGISNIYYIDDVIFTKENFDIYVSKRINSIHIASQLIIDICKLCIVFEFPL